MTDAVQIELIRALAVIPASIGSVAAAWFAYKASVHSKEASATAKTIESNTDGLSHQLNALTAKSSHAEGVLDEKIRAEKEAPTVEPAHRKPRNRKSATGSSGPRREWKNPG